MIIPLKAIYRFNTIPIKLPMAFFIKCDQSMSKFVWKHKRPQTMKESWGKKKKKTELEESVSLISGYTTKLQSSEYYGTGTKIDI